MKLMQSQLPSLQSVPSKSAKATSVVTDISPPLNLSYSVGNPTLLSSTPDLHSQSWLSNRHWELYENYIYRSASHSLEWFGSVGTSIELGMHAAHKASSLAAAMQKTILIISKWHGSQVSFTVILPLSFISLFHNVISWDLCCVILLICLECVWQYIEGEHSKVICPSVVVSYCSLLSHITVKSP